MWFFETALALLEGEEETEFEMRLREEGSLAEETVLPRTTAKPHRSQLEGGPSRIRHLHVES